MTLNDETPNRSRGGVTASADGGIVGFPADQDESTAPG